MGEVGVASAVWAGSADGDEHDVGSAHCFGKLGGEGEIARRGIARHQAVEPGLVNGNAAGAQAGDLVRVLVDAGHMMAEIGKTRRSEEHTSELQSLMRISYAVFCLKKKKNKKIT